MAETLGPYILGDRVAATPLADTYRATDSSLGRTVTVKILDDAITRNPTEREGILGAARHAVPLSHPNIAELFDVGEQHGKYFLVFEHTPGETLRATIAGSPLNVRRAVDLGLQLADALAEAHGHGIVHGALRPDAIVITAKGRPKILDFGLASASISIRPSPSATLSPDDVECRSPEQVLGAPGDARTDVFSLGCVLFEMLTGTQPFAAATGADTEVAVLSRTPPPPSQLNASIPEALDRLVARCLAKSLDTRCDSAAAVAAELREIAGQLETDDSANPTMHLGLRPDRRHPGLPTILLLLACVVALVAGALLLLR